MICNGNSIVLPILILNVTIWDMNKTWHENNKMPANPTPKQRAKWHIEHLKNCNCRKPTANIQKLIDEYKKLEGLN